MIKYIAIIILGILLFAGCAFPHNFRQDPDGVGVYERCGVCGGHFDESWHIGYDEHDPDDVIEGIEQKAETEEGYRSE